MVAFMHTGTRLTAGYRYTTLGDATVERWQSHVLSVLCEQIGTGSMVNNNVRLLQRWKRPHRPPKKPKHSC